MTDLSALIARVENGEGADRDLDAAIMFDLFAKPVGKHEADGGPVGYLWPEDNPSWSFGIRFPGKDREWFFRPRRSRAADDETLLLERDGALVLVNDLRIQKLTASLDACLALQERVLPGWFWRVGHGSERPGWAHLNRFHPDHCDRADESTGWAQAPCRAWLAAILRAVQAKGDAK